jgi:cholesterol oxidase
MVLHLRRGIFGSRLGGRSEQGRFPSYLEVAQRAATHLAREMGGVPQNIVSEVLLGTPATAHILGGACLSSGPEDGVVDLAHEVFGQPGLYVCDGSVIPVNLGVNPSLTIVALAERFASRFPSRAKSG